jgi:polyferredoxin
MRQPMSARKKIVRVLFVFLVVPLLGLLVWSFALQPLKYR